MNNNNTTSASSSNYVSIQKSSDDSDEVQPSQGMDWNVNYDSPAEGYIYPCAHQYRNPQDNDMSIQEANLESSEDEVTDDPALLPRIMRIKFPSSNTYPLVIQHPPK